MQTVQNKEPDRKLEELEVMSGDSGTPFVELSTESQASRAFAAALEPILTQTNGNPLSYPSDQY